MHKQVGPRFSDTNELRSYFEHVDRRLKEDITSRPSNIRLPSKGSRFRALRDTVVDVVTYFRGGEEWLFLPMQIQRGAIPQEATIRLDYEPNPSESTHCSLVPEQYEELELILVDADLRNDPEYSGFNFSVSYLQLDKDFDWLQD